jgi:UPF0755 protein
MTARKAQTPHTRPFRPRRWALLLLLAAGAAVIANLLLPAGPFPPRERRVILVQRGETLRGVARELERVGVLHGTLGFEVLARLMRLDHHIKAGQYSFRLGITVPALLHAFARGMSGLSLITIPEGLTESEISLLLSNRLGVPIASFDSLAHDRKFLDSLSVKAPSIEGYLAPDTYEFLPGTSPEVAFRTMANRQREVLLRETAGRDSLPLGMSLHKVLTLASIVESEAQIKDERARIARVYLNRLERHMRLQADPTVGYSLGIGPRSRLYLRQLRFESPFNTYLYEGLPPGPICNPGRAAIQAVLEPSNDVNDLYFVARGEGRHFFATTYEQHLKNIALARSMIAATHQSTAITARESLTALHMVPPESAAAHPAPAAATAETAHVKKAGVPAVVAPPAVGAKTTAKVTAKETAKTPAKVPAKETAKAPAKAKPTKTGKTHRKKVTSAGTTTHRKKPAHADSTARHHGK